MALHDDAVTLGGRDPLTRALSERRPDGLVVRALGERQADAMARRLDLGDRVEPGASQPGAICGVSSGDLGVGRDDGHAALDQPVRQVVHALGCRLATVVRILGIDDRAPRDVRARPADDGERAGQHQRGVMVVDEHE